MVLLENNSYLFYRKSCSIELRENSSFFSSFAWKCTAPNKEENGEHGKSESFPCYREIIGVALRILNVQNLHSKKPRSGSWMLFCFN